MQALLTELQQLASPGQLRGWVTDHRPRLSLSFLQWLAGLEAQAQGQEQQQLSILCGQLVAAREGLGAPFHTHLPVSQDLPHIPQVKLTLCPAKHTAEACKF